MIAPFLGRLPFIAILRGVRPAEVVSIAAALVDEGFTIVEVPLNSPDAMKSIAALTHALGDDVLVGAGTVRTTEQVRQSADVGGRLVVMPHGDPDVVRAARAQGLSCVPGVATPTEGFAALANGADALKLFPAELLTPSVLRAYRSVFPSDASFIPVGGIVPGSLAAYLAAGASGFGLGSALYRAGDEPAAVAASARSFVAAWRDIGGSASI